MVNSLENVYISLPFTFTSDNLSLRILPIHQLMAVILMLSIIVMTYQMIIRITQIITNKIIPVNMKPMTTDTAKSSRKIHALLFS